MSYVFKGIVPFLTSRAAARDVTPPFAAKAHNTWHAKQIQNSLGSISEYARMPASPATTVAKAGAMSHAISVAHALLAAAEGCVDAILETAAAHGMDVGNLDEAKIVAAATAEFEAFKAEAAQLEAKLKADLDAALAEVAKLKTELAKLKTELAKPTPPPAPKPAPNAPTSK